MATALDKFVPPVLLDLYTRYVKTAVWKGVYTSWSEAEAQSAGYDQANILQKVEDAAMAVKKGRAAYERDSVLFYEADYEWPLLGMLMYATNAVDHPLHLVDFGGSLGSLYFQHKQMLPADLSWTVVEQDHFVSLGKSKFAEGQLNFSETIQSAGQIKPVDSILVSCVIEYMPDHLWLLKELNNSGAETIIFYNTPFSYTDKEIISVQRVNKKIYEASYPCRFIPKATVIQQLSNYTLVAECTSGTVIHHEGNAIPYEGLLLKRVQK